MIEQRNEKQGLSIVIASGKGGTGKTTVATSLALSLAGDGNNGNEVVLVDCDVEAPNAHLFLDPKFDRQAPAVILIPEINKEQCTLCGKCVEVCQFHALAKLGSTLMVFPQLCHGCGSCTWNCPEGAITENANPIGVLESGIARDGIIFARGMLSISEPMATPIIRQLKRWVPQTGSQIKIYDAPPGASCSVVETLNGADFVLLVTEPTPFGLHDLHQILGILAKRGTPAAIVLNRDGIGDDQLLESMKAANIPIWMRIPYEPEIAAGIAAGKALTDIKPSMKADFIVLYERIAEYLKETIA